MEKTYLEADNDFLREHVTPYIYENPTLFNLYNVDSQVDLHYPEFRLTVDCLEDLNLIRQIYKNLYREAKVFSANEIVTLLRKKSNLLNLNANIKQKVLNE